MNQTFTQADKTMNCKTKISRVPSRARAHAPLLRACVRGTRSLILNAAVILAVLLGIGAGNRVMAQQTFTVTVERTSSGFSNSDQGVLTPSGSNNGVFTYTPPVGFYISKIECVGGGGGGQGSSNSTTRGDGGGAGAYYAIAPGYNVISTTSSITSISLTVGAHGTGGTGNSSTAGAGSDGDPSSVSFGSLTYTAGGGKSGGNTFPRAGV